MSIKVVFEIILALNIKKRQLKIVIKRKYCKCVLLPKYKQKIKKCIIHVLIFKQ